MVDGCFMNSMVVDMKVRNVVSMLSCVVVWLLGSRVSMVVFSMGMVSIVFRKYVFGLVMVVCCGVCVGCGC